MKLFHATATETEATRSTRTASDVLLKLPNQPTNGPNTEPNRPLTALHHVGKVGVVSTEVHVAALTFTRRHGCVAVERKAHCSK